MFDKAEKVDPAAAGAGGGSSRAAAPATFTGRGFSLGRDESESVPVPVAAAGGVPRPEPKTYKVTVWKGNAFQLDDGAVRFPDDPINRKFMEDLSAGHVPEELRERDQQGMPVPVNVNLSDHREEDPANATVVKPKFAAFKGGGNTLGSDWSSEAFQKVQAAAAGGAGAAAKEKQAKELQELTPPAGAQTTTVQVRLPTGQRVSASLLPEWTVGMLRRWIGAAGHVPAAVPFNIIAGFPPKPLENEAQTLQEAGLCNACVTVKPN